MTKCCVPGCKNYTDQAAANNQKGVKFFSFPCGGVTPISKERHRRWVQALSVILPSITDWPRTRLLQSKLCSDHFISGRANKLLAEDPDFAPSIFPQREDESGKSQQKQSQERRSSRLLSKRLRASFPDKDEANPRKKSVKVFKGELIPKPEEPSKAKPKEKKRKRKPKPKEFLCEMCKQKTSSLGRLQTHQRFYCPGIMKTTEEVMQILGLPAAGQSSSSTGSCDKTTNEDIEWLTEISSGKPFKCFQCQEGFQFPTQLKDHLEVCSVHSSMKGGSEKAEQQVTDTLSDFPVQLQDRDSSKVLNDKHIPCFNCPQSFDKSSQLIEHHKTCQIPPSHKTTQATQDTSAAAPIMLVPNLAHKVQRHTVQSPHLSAEDASSPLAESRMTSASENESGDEITIHIKKETERPISAQQSLSRQDDLAAYSADNNDTEGEDMICSVYSHDVEIKTESDDGTTVQASYSVGTVKKEESLRDFRDDTDSPYTENILLSSSNLALWRVKEEENCSDGTHYGASSKSKKTRLKTH